MNSRQVNGNKLAKMITSQVPSPLETQAAIKGIRLALGLTRGHLGAILFTPRDTIRNWEVGRTIPPPMARQRISDLWREVQDNERAAASAAD